MSHKIAIAVGGFCIGMAVTLRPCDLASLMVLLVGVINLVSGWRSLSK